MLLKVFIDGEYNGGINRFAKASNLSQGTVSRLYRGIGNPTARTARKILSASNGIVTHTDLIKGIKHE